MGKMKIGRRSMFSVIVLLGTMISVAPITAATPQAKKIVVADGQLQSKDLSGLPVDGDALIKLNIDGAGTIVVHIPSGERRCAVTPGDFINGLRVGDQLRVRGVAIAANHLEICAPGTLIERRRLDRHRR